MLRAMRVHSNFAEYVPLALLLIYFGEVQGGLEFMVHAALRIFAGYGLSLF